MDYSLCCFVLCLVWSSTMAWEGGSLEDLMTARESLFYMHEFPEEMMSSWPTLNASHKIKSVGSSDHKPQSRMRFQLKYALNTGAGYAVDERKGLYSSVDYQLYTMIMARLRVHPRRTYDKTRATVFVLPYDVGIAAQWDKETGEYRMHQKNACPDHVAVSERVAQAIQSTSMQGHDHLIINSLYGLFHENCEDILEKCDNCTVLTVDGMNHIEYEHYVTLRKTGREPARRWYSMPHTSIFHWNGVTTEEVLPWRVGANERPILITFWGASNVNNNISRKKRVNIIKKCGERPDVCHLVEVHKREYNQCITGSDSTNCVKEEGATAANATGPKKGTPTRHPHSHNLTTGFEAYMHSIFCLQPPGDTETRKGIYDSFILGCIPVIFNRYALHKTAPWWFTEAVEDATTVNLQFQSHETSNIVEHLMNISAADIRAKQEAIAKLAPLVHYATIPKSMEGVYAGWAGRRGPQDGARPEDPASFYSPPFRDAVDVMLDEMARRVLDLRRGFGVPADERADKVHSRYCAFYHSYSGKETDKSYCKPWPAASYKSSVELTVFAD